MKKLARLFETSERIRLAAFLKPALAVVKSPKRKENGIGELLKDARKNLPPALAREVRRFAIGGIAMGMNILGVFAALGAVFLGIKHKSLKPRLLREPRYARHILGVIRPRLVVRPVKPLMIAVRRHPK